MNMPSSTPPKPVTPPAAGDIATLLDDPGQLPWWRRWTLWLALALIVAAGAGWYFWRLQAASDAAPAYTTETVTRGDLTLSVTANGTLQPTRAVSIGSELSGTISSVLVDVNDRVRKGQVLVRLDTAKLSGQIARSRASLAAAQARVLQAAATVKEARSNLARLEEVARLSGGKVPSKAELDSGRAGLDRAVADETSARAGVADAQAALGTDEINLSKASIQSPIDGVVLTRSVEPGNAVAASLQAVTLFSIAEDLAKLRLQVNVDEADVGSVQVGQKASFTVSAYPSRQYPAKVTRVAFGSTTTDNVVTYITYLEVDNTDLSLRPGMTATATIAARQASDVLLVPSSALRFNPAAAAAKQAAAASSSGSLVSKLMPQRPGGQGQRRAGGAGNGEGGSAKRQVWVLRDGQAVAVAVTAGISDGRLTEVTSPELKVGMAVITDQRSGALR
ncbi:MAG: efflux RND transporter periplasmic adaptor subunit [Burkholderiaceae bacterium]|nr:efflux RND transporter periplasmic adaptor subunit [Burkholderiaceae bacterium]